MVKNLKPTYSLISRNGTYYWQDRKTMQQGSLRTKDKTEAERLLHAKNEATQNPALSLHMARAYLAVADPTLAKRTWREVFSSVIQSKQGENAARWERAQKDEAFETLMNRPLLETRPDQFLKVLQAGTVSTNVYLRRLHNFALGFGWLLTPVLPPKQWPKVKHQVKRAITQEEHERIVAREQNSERKAYYELLWELGGSQGDIAKLVAEDIDWNQRVISYFRAKTGQAACIRFDETVEAILQRLPSQGPLFPYLRTVRSSDRATEFKQRCAGLNIRGVTLHSYRYSWAERARECGFPERLAQEVLGHGSKAVHRAYARGANPEQLTLGAWKKRQQAQNVVTVEFQAKAKTPANVESPAGAVGTVAG
jgi:integrase